VDQAGIEEGIALVRYALERRPPGRFALMAAIAAVHAQAPSWDATDWGEIVGLYDILVQIWPSPVVALNRAVAVGPWPKAPRPGWTPSTRSPLTRFSPPIATSRRRRADFLGKVWAVAVRPGRPYEEALLLSENVVERAFLEQRIGRIEAEGAA